MIDPLEKLAALRNLANDPTTTEQERDSARRRIAEIMAKHGIGEERAKATFTNEPRPMSDVISEIMNGLGIDFGDDYGWPEYPKRNPACTPSSKGGYGFGGYGEVPYGYPPEHVNERCHYEPVDSDDVDPMDGSLRRRVVTIRPTTRFTGRRLSEFAHYVCDQWREHADRKDQGPYGFVSISLGEKSDDHVQFIWRCRVCRDRVDLKVPWRRASSALKEGDEGIDRLLMDLFSIWSGYEDNRCSRCGYQGWRTRWK